MSEEISMEDFVKWKKHRAAEKDAICDFKACRSVHYCVESYTDPCCLQCYRLEHES